jgi:hypothetical protein
MVAWPAPPLRGGVVVGAGPGAARGAKAPRLAPCILSGRDLVKESAAVVGSR